MQLSVIRRVSPFILMPIPGLNTIFTSPGVSCLKAGSLLHFMLRRLKSQDFTFTACPPVVTVTSSSMGILVLDLRSGVTIVPYFKLNFVPIIDNNTKITNEK